MKKQNIKQKDITNKNNSNYIGFGRNTLINLLKLQEFKTPEEIEKARLILHSISASNSDYQTIFAENNHLIKSSPTHKNTSFNWIDERNNLLEVWEIVIHLTKILSKTFNIDIYPRTTILRKDAKRMEIGCLVLDKVGGVINVLIYPRNKDLFEFIISKVDDTITTNLKLHLTISKEKCDTDDYIIIDFKYTPETPLQALYKN